MHLSPFRARCGGDGHHKRRWRPCFEALYCTVITTKCSTWPRRYFLPTFEELTTKLFFIPPLMVQGTATTLVLTPFAWKNSDR